MKAMRYHDFGGSEVLVHEDVEPPVAGAGQVRLRVAGAGFNPVDVPIRRGIMRELFPVELPHIPGIEVAGVITEIGDAVSGWNLGDAVIANLPMTAPGATAEYALAPAEALAAAPVGVDLAEAAGLPVAGLTAWQALFEAGGLRSGHRILVNGAGGAVGGIAVQLAVRAGAAVTATAGPRSRDRLEALGGTELVDYTVTPVAEALAGQRFDVVLNLVRTQPEQNLELLKLVTDGGVFVGTTGPVEYDGSRGVRTVQFYLRADAARLAELGAQVGSGELESHVAAKRPMTELADIHDAAVADRLPGKTILIP